MHRLMSGALALVFLLTACSKGMVRETPEQKRAKAEVQLGLGYLQQNKVKLAIERLHRAVDADSSYVPANHALALAYQQAGMADEAETYFRNALRLDRKNSRLNNNYGTFLCQQGKIEDSVDYFLRAAKDPLYETPAQAYENAGLCMLKAKKTAEAETYFRSALRISKNLPVSLREMAKISFAQKKYFQTRAFIQRFEELESLDLEGLRIAIQVESKLGDLKASEKYTRILQAKYPESDEAKRLLDSKEGS